MEKDIFSFDLKIKSCSASLPTDTCLSLLMALGAYDTKLGCVINVWVTEAGCTETHSELTSALQKTGQNSYAEFPWSRSWLEEERLVN